MAVQNTNMFYVFYRDTIIHSKKTRYRDETEVKWGKTGK